jgi:hypothetical protein
MVGGVAAIGDKLGKKRLQKITEVTGDLFKVSGVSPAAGLNSGQFDRKRNSKKRISNIE